MNKKTKITEIAESEKPMFDVNYVAKVLEDIMNKRNDGYVYTMHVKPKEKSP